MQTVRVVVAEQADYGAAGHAVTAHAVEDRLVETGLGSKGGVDVQRVQVSRQAIDGGLFRAAGQLDAEVEGAVIRQRMRLGLALGGTAEAAISTHEGGPGGSG
ncbi:hypothetical protein D3C78_1623620 [compost metagenome]